MANTHLAYADLALDKLSGTEDPDQDAESFIQLIERKINFALGDALADAGELVNYTFSKKALFSSLLRGTAAEWYEINITKATTWQSVRTDFITRFSDGRNKFRYQMEAEHCIRGDGEEIRNFLQRIKRTVDKGWPDDLNGIEAAHHNAERDPQGRQRGQRYIDYSLKRLRPRYLQRKAQEYMMENPKATWNDFSTRIIQRDVSFQVSSNFLNVEEQTKAQMATLGQERKNIRSEVREHRVNAVEGTTKAVDPNQKGRQNTTRFCNYCRTNGHTPNWCCKKIRHEELKRIENERTAEKKVTFTQDYNKKRAPDHGSEQWTRGQDFQRRNQNFTNDTFRRSSLNAYQNSSPRQILHIGTTIRMMEDHYTNAQISHSIEAMETNLEMNLSTIETGGTRETFLVPHRPQGETSHKIIPIGNQEVINPITLRSAGMTIDLRLALRPMNKTFRKTIIRLDVMWSSSPQLTKPLTNYQTSVR